MDKFKWTNKQIEALSMIKDDKSTDIFLYGGGRSAKTFCLVAAIIKRALIDPQSRHAIVRSAFTDVRNSIGMQTLPDVMRKVFPGIKWKMNQRDWVIEFKDKNPQIWLCGVENNERVEKVLGLGLNTVFMNEVSQIGYRTFYTLMTRLASKGVQKNKIFLDANPPAQYHWTYKRYILGVEPQGGLPLDTSGFRVLQMNPTDNMENLEGGGQVYIERLKSLPQHVQERYLYGEFAKGTDSAVFARELDDVERTGRRGVFEKQETLPIHAIFDIGVGDATAIWFAQFLPDKIYLIDYYEKNREAMPYYINYAINRCKYKLASVVLPHDAKNKNWGTGRTIRESADELGKIYKFGVHVLPDARIADGINSARMLFPRIYFDRKRTANGYEALQNYQYVYSEKKGRESDTPLHNWASHGADAFRYVCMYYQRWNIYDPVKRNPSHQYTISNHGLGTFREIFAAKGIKI
jgi:PBSX family phage terminase large subunit